MRKRTTTLGLIAGSGLALYGWQRWRSAKERTKHIPLGQVHNINGRKQHIWEQGSGSPLIVICGGLSSISADWQLVFAQLPNDIHIMVIDRPGLGWSDPIPTPRTVRHMAKELKETLTTLGHEDTPLILLGHSLGVMVCQLFAHLYPEQVVGALLIDGAHESFFKSLPHTYQQLMGLNKPLISPMARFGARLGLNRWGVNWVKNRPLPEYPDGFWERFTPEGHRQFWLPRQWPEYIDTIFDELADFPESCAQVETARQANPRPFGRKPLIALTADPTISAKRFNTVAPQRFSAENFVTYWQKIQTEISQLSRNGELRIASGSGHNIPAEKPEIVTQAIIDLVERVRQN